MAEPTDIYSCAECGASFTRVCKLQTHSKYHMRPQHETSCDNESLDSDSVSDCEGSNVPGAAKKKFLRKVSALKTASPIQEKEKQVASDSLSNSHLSSDQSSSSSFAEMHQRGGKRSRMTTAFTRQQFRGDKAEEVVKGEWSEISGPAGKKYVCHECSQEFRRLPDMVVHARIHSGHRPHICHICGKGFTQSSALYTHRRIHTGERPYQCKICKKQFRESSKVTRHLRVHTGEKPYTCTLCGKGFTQSGTLKIHLSIHDRPNTRRRGRRARSMNQGKPKLKVLKNRKAKEKRSDGLTKKQITDCNEGWAVQELQSFRVESSESEMSLEKKGYHGTTEYRDNSISKFTLNTRITNTNSSVPSSENMHYENLNNYINFGRLAQTTSALFTQCTGRKSISRVQVNDTNLKKLQSSSDQGDTDLDPLFAGNANNMDADERCNSAYANTTGFRFPETTANQQEDNEHCLSETSCEFPVKNQDQLRRNRRFQRKPRKLGKGTLKEVKMEERLCKSDSNKTHTNVGMQTATKEETSQPDVCVSEQLVANDVVFFKDDTECIEVVVQTSSIGESVPIEVDKREISEKTSENTFIPCNRIVLETTGDLDINNIETRKTTLASVPDILSPSRSSCPEDNTYLTSWKRTQENVLSVDIQPTETQISPTIASDIVHRRNILGDLVATADSDQVNGVMFLQREQLPKDQKSTQEILGIPWTGAGQTHVCREQTCRDQMSIHFELQETRYIAPQMARQNSLGLVWHNSSCNTTPNFDAGYSHFFQHSFYSTHPIQTDTLHSTLPKFDNVFQNVNQHRYIYPAYHPYDHY